MTPAAGKTQTGTHKPSLKMTTPHGGGGSNGGSDGGAGGGIGGDGFGEEGGRGGGLGGGGADGGRGGGEGAATTTSRGTVTTPDERLVGPPPG